MTQPTHDEVKAWIDERIQEREDGIERNDSVVRELSLAQQYEEDGDTSATIIHLENLIRIDKEIRGSLLANRAGLERHKPIENDPEEEGLPEMCNCRMSAFPCPTYTDFYNPIVSVM